MTEPGQMSPTSHGKHPLICWAERTLAHSFAWVATTVYGLNGGWRVWRPLLMRASAHLAVVAVAILAIGLSKIELPARAGAPLPLAALSAPVENPQAKMTAVSTADTSAQPRDVTELSADAGVSGAIIRVALPNTIIPERPRLGVFTYTVEAGDTVQTIAAAYGLQPATIMWSNPAVEEVPDMLSIGQELVILPVDGVYHTVAEGETLETIAEKYKSTPEAITGCTYNGLEAPLYRIDVGMRLIVPGGEKPYVAKTVTTYEGPVPEDVHGSGQFLWPVGGTISQGYWYGHRAIDVAAPLGSAVQAADAGYVSFAGWTDIGYGYLVVLDHANGYSTYYAHLSSIYVSAGQAVERGQVMAAVGSTGWSTGPHLHFEVRLDGSQQNPRAYLP